MSSSAMRLVHHCAACAGGASPGATRGRVKAKRCPPAGPRFEGQWTAELLGHQIEDNVQAEAGSALVAARREEGIERAALDLLAHAHAVVGHEDIDVVADLPRLDDDAS